MPSSESLVQTITGPPLMGVYLHDPDDAAGTSQQFMYAPHGRSEKRAVESEMLVFAGRSRPVAEFGELEADTLDVTLMVPHDETWLSGVEAIKATYRKFRTYHYRDNRGRAWYGVLRGLTFEDVREGTQVSFTFERVAHSAIPASLAVTALLEES